MKVLESGNPSGAWKNEVICTGKGNGNDGCGALLEIKAPDLFHTAHYDYGGGSDHYITIECIECHKWTDIIKNDVPAGVRTTVMATAPRSSNRSGNDNGAK